MLLRIAGRFWTDPEHQIQELFALPFLHVFLALVFELSALTHVLTQLFFGWGSPPHPVPSGLEVSRRGIEDRIRKKSFTDTPFFSMNGQIKPSRPGVWC